MFETAANDYSFHYVLFTELQWNRWSECWTTAIPKTAIAISLWTRVQLILSLVSVMVLIVVGPNQVIAGISWLREQLMIAEARTFLHANPATANHKAAFAKNCY